MKTCLACQYLKQELVSLGNGQYDEYYWCKKRPILIGDPEANCNYFRERVIEDGEVSKKEYQLKAKKCMWMNKRGECAVNENCMVADPDCSECKYFEESDYDPVSHPDHYTAGRKYEPKDVIRDWNLNFNLGNAVKYISRAGRKNDLIEDLKKARQYLDFEIDYLEGNKCE